MRSKEEIKKVLDDIDTNISKFKAMNYEQGIEAALEWVLMENPDYEEIEYTKYKK